MSSFAAPSRVRLSLASFGVATALTASALIATPATAAPVPAAVSTAAVSTTAVTAVRATEPRTFVPTAAQKAAYAKIYAARVTKILAARAAYQKAYQARVAKVLAARSSNARAKVVALAKSKVGRARYVAGAAGPNRFDCSGLTMYVWKKAGGKSLPHYSRAQYSKLKKVPLSKARPGDLVFFFRKGAHHVALYIGGGKMVGASNPRSGVKIDRVMGPWYGSRFSGAARVVNF